MRAKYLSGSVWSALNAMVSIVVPLAVFVVFARQTPPWQVGVVAYGMAWVEIIKIVTPLGLYEALLSTEDYDVVAGPASAVLLLAGALGWVIYAGVMALAPLWMPAAATLLPFLLALGSRLAFDVSVLQPQAALARRMDFKRLAVRTLIANLAAAAGGVAIGRLATPLAGLVSYYVLQSAVLWAMTVFGTRALVRPAWAWGPLRTIARNAYLATQVRSLGTINNFADQVIAAGFITPAGLALYNLGKRVEIAQITATSSFTANLFQPLFARRTDDGLAADYRRSLFVIALISGVPTALFVANAHALIPTVFGRQWASAAPIAQGLALSGFARAVGGVPGAYFSVNGQNATLRNRALISAVCGVGVVCLTPFVGLAAVAWLLAGKNVAVTAWSAWTTRHLAGPAYYAREVVGVIGAAFAAAWFGRLLAEPAFGHLGLPGLLTIWTLSAGAAALGMAALYTGELRRIVGGWLRVRLKLA